MPRAGIPAERSVALRCSRCGAAVGGTLHTRGGYTVGHYILHTGRTEEATLRRGTDEVPLVYRRLVEPVVFVACPECYAAAEVQRLWETFGDAEQSAA